jgi:hypothetical protein
MQLVSMDLNGTDPLNPQVPYITGFDCAPSPARLPGAVLIGMIIFADDRHFRSVRLARASSIAGGATNVTSLRV